MAEYRIILQGTDYIVQEKCLWWWSTLKHVIGPGLSGITRFPRLQLARDFIELRRPKSDLEIKVIETRIIL